MTPPAEGERAREIVEAWLTQWCITEGDAADKDLVNRIAAALRAPQPSGLTGDVESLKALARFWNTVFRCFGDNDDLEPLVEAAEKAGLIKQGAHAQPCEIEHCPCEGEWTWMYEETPLAHALRALDLSAIEGAPECVCHRYGPAFDHPTAVCPVHGNVRNAIAATRAAEGAPAAGEREALEWLLNLSNGVGKAGGRASVAEWHDAWEAARRVVAPASPRSAAPEDK